MIRKITIILFIMLFAFHALTALPVECDKGVIPFGNYIVEEPGQKAIIGWNGSVEVLILSNDLLGEIESYSGFKGKIQVLEILPLPSLPKIMDEEIVNKDIVLTGGGSQYTLVKIKVKDLLKVLSPIIANISK